MNSLAIALAILSWSPAPDTPAKRPNIIVVYTDDMGIGDLGCYGGTLAKTPRLDRMGSEGTRLTRYYSASPICSPSRTGLITGTFPARWRITSYLQTRAGNRGCEQVDFLDPKAPILPRVLKQSGYATAHFGKWHLGGGRDVVDAPKFAAYGYDEHASTWESPEPLPDLASTANVSAPTDKIKRWNRTAFYVDRTLDFIDRHKDKPCFVNLWADDVHTPWIPDEESWPKPGAATKAQAKTKAAAKSKAQAKSKSALPTGDPAKFKRVMEEYDRQIGRLLDGLKRLGVDGDTLVIFTSDNGAMPTLGGRRSLDLRASKLSLYEGGIRMPFIARWPGKIPAGRVVDDAVVASVDLFPTLCRIARAEIPSEAALDGRDVGELLLGGKSAPRERPLFWEYGRNDLFFAYPNGRDRSPNLAVMEGDLKLLINSDGTRAELYDVKVDRSERRDLAAERPDDVKRLSAAALDWWKSLPKLDPDGK